MYYYIKKKELHSLNTNLLKIEVQIYFYLYKQKVVKQNTG